MASIHQKVKGGTWHVSYREKGRLKHRSLGTASERKALELKREIELLIEERGIVEVVISAGERLVNPADVHRLDHDYGNGNRGYTGNGVMSCNHAFPFSYGLIARLSVAVALSRAFPAWLWPEEMSYCKT